jgi:tetratricopeptide (TPR) repeat protein
MPVPDPEPYLPKLQIHESDSPGLSRQLGLGLVLVALTLLTYNQVTSAGFINFDDPQYVLNNAHVREGLSWNTLRWAFTAYEAGNWHPLTWISHALDIALFGLNPAGHHYGNVLFHAADAVLLFLLLLSATGRRELALVAAALWALHPVNVESVAWISERKNVLSMFFLLLAMLAYVSYARRRGLWRYAAVFFLFALGLMSKPQVITLPFMLLLWDIWPLRRLAPDTHDEKTLAWLLIEKLPLFLLTAASAVLTIHAQRLGHAVRTIGEFSFASRVENALVSYAKYFGMAFWPVRLAPLYPHPEASLPAWQIVGGVLLLMSITALVLWQFRRPYLLVGWLWFLGTLVPMIGLVQVGQQAMADRYAYIPLVGLLVMAVWGADEFTSKYLPPAGRITLAALALIGLAAVTYRQIGYWQNSETLWAHTLSVTEKNYTAHSNLADTLARQGRSDEAIVHFEAAERLHYYQPVEILDLGRYEQQTGHLDGAIRQFKLALQSDDRAIRREAWNSLAGAYMQGGDRPQAKESYRQALAIAPDDTQALVGSGLLTVAGDPQLAATYFRRAVSAAPSDVGWLLLAAALQGSGQLAESKTAFENAGKISSDSARAQLVAAQLLREVGGLSK